ncbi:WW domain binding protein VOPP1 isoform X1 [Microcebus murinus]|uniref:WW domain binding protein VOPP1 isoform X1 n=1 Tax=Microcebus murinus TaxID=30608 RepID=UPI003F6D6D61
MPLLRGLLRCPVLRAGPVHTAAVVLLVPPDDGRALLLWSWLLHPEAHVPTAADRGAQLQRVLHQAAPQPCPRCSVRSSNSSYCVGLWSFTYALGASTRTHVSRTKQLPGHVLGPCEGRVPMVCSLVSLGWGTLWPHSEPEAWARLKCPLGPYYCTPAQAPGEAEDTSAQPGSSPHWTVCPALLVYHG